MLVIKAIAPGSPLPREIDARTLCGDDVTVHIGRSGLNPFTISYQPSAAARWRSFPVSDEARAVMSGCLPHGALFVAYQDDEPVGQAAAVLSSSGWCHLLDLRVDAAHRLVGVGRSLLDACQRFAAKNGMAGLHLVVSDLNPVMCQFCEHCGFRLEGIDRMACAMLPEERVKPLLQRACALHFYRQNERG